MVRAHPANRCGLGLAYARLLADIRANDSRLQQPALTGRRRNDVRRERTLDVGDVAWGRSAASARPTARGIVIGLPRRPLPVLLRVRAAQVGLVQPRPPTLLGNDARPPVGDA